MKTGFKRILRNANGAGRSLDASAFKGRHQVLEALAFDTAKQVLGLHLEIIESDFVFLHPAIAEDFDLAAGHAVSREGGVVCSARLLRKQHGETREIVCGGISPGQQCHQIGSHGMRDPCLVACDTVMRAVVGLHGACPQRAKVRAGIRFSEDGRWQDFSAGYLRQPMGLLVVRSANQDQLRRDL